MAINWNQAEFVSPKIQIAPEQLPLEAGMKVGATLQDRFDKSYENATKTGEAIRQMVNAANPIDKPVAEEVFGQYKSQLDEIAKSGKYHDMRWKTLKLAQEAANNYMSIAERNKQIQAQEEMISKDPRWSLSRDKKLKDFRNSLKSLQYNVENNTFNNSNIPFYSAPADVNIQEKSIKYGSLMKPKDFGYENGSILYEKADGTPTKNFHEASAVFHVIDGKKTSRLFPEEIQKAVKNAIINDAEVKAMIDWDLKYEGIDPNNPEQQEAYQNYLNNTIDNQIKAASNLLKVDNEFTSFNETVSGGKRSGEGDGNSTDNSKNWIKSSTQTGGEGSTEGATVNPFSAAAKPQYILEKAIKGDADSWNVLQDAADYNIENSKTNGEKEQFLEFKTLLKDFQKLSKKYPEFANTLSLETAGAGTAIHDVFNVMRAAFLESIPALIETYGYNSDKLENFNNERKAISEKMDKFFGKGFNDTKIENGIEKYLGLPSQSVATSVPMITPSVNNGKMTNAIKTFSSQLNHDDVSFFQKEKGFDASKGFEIQKFSTEPKGNGTGIIFQVKDAEGKTALMEPNYQGNLSIIEDFENASGIPITFANAFKYTRPFSKVGSKRTFGELVKENQLESTMVGEVLNNPELKDLNITKTKDGYKIDGVAQVYSSYIEAIHDIMSIATNK